MPLRSKAQARLMEGVAHSPEFAKKVGIKQSVGKEFVASTTKDEFAKLKEHLKKQKKREKE